MVALRSIRCMRAYLVRRQFSFKGTSYQPGTAFDPRIAQCDKHKLDQLIRRGLLDPDADPTIQTTVAAPSLTLKPLKQPKKEEEVENKEEDIEKASVLRRRRN